MKHSLESFHAVPLPRWNFGIVRSKWKAPLCEQVFLSVEHYFKETQLISVVFMGLGSRIKPMQYHTRLATFTLLILRQSRHGNQFHTNSRVGNRAGAVADAFLNYPQFPVRTQEHFDPQVLQVWSGLSSSSPTTFIFFFFASVFPTIWNQGKMNLA